MHGISDAIWFRQRKRPMDFDTNSLFTSLVKQASRIYSYVQAEWSVGNLHWVKFIAFNSLQYTTRKSIFGNLKMVLKHAYDIN